MNPHKADMLAAVMDEFDLHTVAYIGKDEDFPGALVERLGEREVESPGDEKADCVFLDDYPEDIVGAIKLAFSKVREGGFLLGSERGVAECFNLMLCQVGPAGVWCVRK